MTLAETFDLITGACWLALGVVLARMTRLHRAARTWLVVGTAFCTLRAFDYLFVSSGVFESGPLVRVLDAAVFLTLLSLVFGVGRLGRGLARQQAEAEHAEGEYGRALLDYTQLVRHRIANPLTAVKGGIQTLLDLDLDASVQRQMLEAMLESAVQLEQVALHPEQVGEEEAELKPSPAPLRPEQARAALGSEAGQVEADFRDVNRELIDVVKTPSSRSLTFVCECSARDCTMPITMSLDEYYVVHADGAQFTIAPNHNLPAIEDVVFEGADWWVVRKRGKPAREARRRA